jgi:hypothetical protein
MPGENKRISGAQKLHARPDLDLERRPDGGPKVEPQQEMAKRKPYGFTEPLSDVPAETRHSDGVNPPGSFPVEKEPEAPQEERPPEMFGAKRS